MATQSSRFAAECVALIGRLTIHDPKERIQPGPLESKAEWIARHLDDKVTSSFADGSVAAEKGHQAVDIHRADAGSVQRDPAFAGLAEPLDDLRQMVTALSANQRPIETDDGQAV